MSLMRSDTTSILCLMYFLYFAPDVPGTGIHTVVSLPVLTELRMTSKVLNLVLHYLCTVAHWPTYLSQG